MNYTKLIGGIMNNYPKQIRVSEDTHHLLKIISATEKKEVGKLVEEALKMYLIEKIK